VAGEARTSRKKPSSLLGGEGGRWMVQGVCLLGWVGGGMVGGGGGLKEARVCIHVRSSEGQVERGRYKRRRAAWPGRTQVSASPSSLAFRTK
jgi:hypothetical protein